MELWTLGDFGQDVEYLSTAPISGKMHRISPWFDNGPLFALSPLSALLVDGKVFVAMFARNVCKEARGTSFSISLASTFWILRALTALMRTL